MAGTPIAKLYRLHGLKANVLYHWKKQMEQGLRDPGELIPKSRLLSFQR